jgi:hypothetical protein
VGDFESDNRMDEDLESLVLEGGGGGGNHESYDLALYFLARKTYLEPYEKFGKRGYAFIIGDERAYPTVQRTQVKRYIGDTPQDNIPIEDIIAEVSEKYNLFYVFAKEGSYMSPQVLGKVGDNQPDGARLWRPLLNQNAIQLDETEAVCETIALSIGLCEGAVGLDDGLADLKENGATDASVKATGEALVHIGLGSGIVVGGAKTSAVAETSGVLPGLD